MTENDWQLIIGVTASINAVQLIDRYRIVRDMGIFAAILPRVFIAVIFMIDGLIPEPHPVYVRDLDYISLILLFATSIVNMIAERLRK